MLAPKANTTLCTTATSAMTARSAELPITLSSPG